MEGQPLATVNGHAGTGDDDWIEMDGGAGDAKQSRFRVAKVDFCEEKMPKYNADSDDECEEDEEEEEDDDDDDKDSRKMRGQSPQEKGDSTTCSDTRNRSFRHYTREALPRLDHYRNVMSIHRQIARPTLDELHNVTMSSLDGPKVSDKLRKASVGEVLSGKPATKLGWIQGVLIRCLLNIWGVMLFLRLSWVVGRAGIGLGIVVILLATAVTFLTTLSMSAICTNGEVKGGGTYYMISRSLGPEFGGSIGLIFALANAVAVAMYVIGFAEPLRDLMKDNGTIIVDGDMNDCRIIGICTVLFLLGIAIIGTEWESKAQLVLLVILLVSMINFVVGSFIPTQPKYMVYGYVGWNLDIGTKNFAPDFRDESFFSVFAIFFPAATGILAGANISGDLADPQRAIPKGTFLSILISSACYIFFAVIAGFTVTRDANGCLSAVENSTNLESLLEDTTLLDYVQNCTFADQGKCKFGLQNYFENMRLVSAFGPLIYAGIFAATLSSALASLVSAPKVFQALCKDKLFPHIHVFAKGYGKNNEPRRGYILTFFIALACVAIGELNAIAPIISNFFLAAYCLINFSCFHASFSSSPGFRPAFKYYNMWLSLAGAILCLLVMFTMNWWTALLTFGVVLSLYTFIYYRKPDVNWGSSTQAQSYKSALNSVTKLNMIQDHVKNYRPQILVLTGNPSSRPPLVDFANCITKKLSLMICGHYVKGPQPNPVREARTRNAYNWLNKRKVKSFYSLIEEETFSQGVRSMLQTVGLGKLRPNLILMGFKSNWSDCDPQDLLDYFDVIHTAFDMHLAFGILRLKEGIDYTQYVDLEEILTPKQEKTEAPKGTLAKNHSTAQMSQGGNSSRESSPPPSPTTERSKLNSLEKNAQEGQQVHSTQVIKGLSKDLPKDVLSNVSQFQRKQRKGSIDVWWLYDDGGLTMLIPYLLTTRAQWSACKLRVFTLANRKDELDREKRNMAALLSKFRIDYSDVIVIPDIVKPPQESSKKEFEEVIEKWKAKEDHDDEDEGGEGSLLITEPELLALKDKTYRHIRLREMLKQHSIDASLIVMTLPMPRKGTVSAAMYMAWLETLTKGMPPFLLVRGNQTNVLTFYS